MTKAEIKRQDVEKKVPHKFATEIHRITREIAVATVNHGTQRALAMAMGALDGAMRVVKALGIMEDDELEAYVSCVYSLEFHRVRKGGDRA